MSQHWPQSVQELAPIWSQPATLARAGEASSSATDTAACRAAAGPVDGEKNPKRVPVIAATAAAAAVSMPRVLLGREAALSRG